MIYKNSYKATMYFILIPLLGTMKSFLVVLKRSPGSLKLGKTGFTNP